MNIIEALEGLVSGKLNIIKTVIVIMKLEARLAGDSLLPLIVNLCMIFGVLITIWLLTMFILGYFLMLAFDNALYALLSIWIVNVSLFFGLFRCVRSNLNNMSFEKTRHYFSKTEQNA
jgi:hypothetical protein